MRKAASWCQPLQDMARPRGARIAVCRLIFGNHSAMAEGRPSSLTIPQYPSAHSADPGYCEDMANAKSIDPFVCNEPAEIGPATSRILKQPSKTADEGRVVPAEQARRRIQQWPSKSSTTKTR